jgi:tetratricopeptide (TPR) repeat protein
MNEHDLRERKAFLEEVEAPLVKSDYLTVLRLAESRLKRMPGDLDARIVICRVWIEQERFKEAGEMLSEMEEILASLSQIYTRMGDIYLRKGMPESAQAFYRTYMSLHPDTPMAREISERLKAVSQTAATDAGAIAEAEEATQVPDHFQTVTLAELYVRQGHLPMAEEVLSAILNRGPHHPKAAELLREVRERIAAQEKSEAGSAPGLPREEPRRMPAPATPGDVDERIVGLEKPAVKPVAELLEELQGLRDKITDRKEPGEKHAPIIAELSRWLNNIGRLSSHAA